MRNDQQRTAQWFKDREGKLTASSFGQAAGLGPSSRQQLWRRMMKLEEIEMNPAMEWGTEHEPVAIDAYRQNHHEASESLDLVGFVSHPSLAWLGGSPDFLVGSVGMGEVKCPVSQKLYGDIPVYYMAQMQGLMQITERNWCDFVVWTPEEMSVQRVMRCDTYWQWLYEHLAEFWIYIEAQCEPPRMKRDKPPATDHLIVANQTYSFAV